MPWELSTAPAQSRLTGSRPSRATSHSRQKLWASKKLSGLAWIIAGQACHSKLQICYSATVEDFSGPQLSESAIIFISLARSRFVVFFKEFFETFVTRCFLDLFTTACIRRVLLPIYQDPVVLKG